MSMGKPQVLKQVNLSAVRKAIMDSGSATRAEIVEATRISVTTVRALLLEMLENGEIEETGQDESSGGRKAVRYQLCKNKYHGVCLCITDAAVRWFIVNICGETGEQGSVDFDTSPSGPIFMLLDDLTNRFSVRVIGIGVPGIPSGLSYLRNGPEGTLEEHAIGRLVQERYKIPVVLENDLNAITYGFARCYLNKYPDEACDDIHMAYLYFEGGCLSAGLLSNGRLLRGKNNYSGELGMFPTGTGKRLDDILADALPAAEYAQIVAKILGGICCVLNPQYIVLGGGSFRKECLPLICECFSNTLPDAMSAEILYAEDAWHDYSIGMAALTAERIFTTMQLIQG